MNKYSGIAVSKFALVLVAALFAFPNISYSNENSDITNRLDRIEREIETVNRAVFKDGKGGGRIIVSGEAQSSSPSSISAFDDRVNNIEESNRDIVNKLEKLNYELNLLKDDFKRMQADYEQRFNELSGNKVVSYKKAVVEDNAPVPVVKQSSVSSTDDQIVYSEGDAEALYNKAFAEVKNSKYDDAKKSFNDFIEKYPEHNLAPNAYYWLGETYYVKGEYKDAAKAFARCFKKYPDSPKALDSLLKLGLSLSTLGNSQDACLSFAQLQKQSKNPNNPLHKRAVAEFEKLNCK